MSEGNAEFRSPNPEPGGEKFPPGGDELAPGVRARSGAVVIRFARSGGPGGQNVNKLNTKADLRIPLSEIQGMPPDAMDRLIQLAGWKINAAGELHLTAEIERTQEGNRSAVLALLRDLITRAMRRPKVRKKTKPSKASKRRRIEAKRHRGEVKRLRKPE